MGTAYRAFDPTLNRRVALKVPRVDSATDPDLRRQFLNEARAAGSDVRRGDDDFGRDHIVVGHVTASRSRANEPEITGSFVASALDGAGSAVLTPRESIASVAAPPWAAAPPRLEPVARMTTPARSRVRFSRPLLAVALGAAATTFGGGCAGLPALGGPGAPPSDSFAETADATDPDGGVVPAGAESPFYEDDLAPTPGAGQEPGRLSKARQWLNRMTGVRGEADVSTRALPPEARAAFETARNDFERGDHGKAASAFKSLSRRYSDTAIEEDSLFYRAEALYEAKKLAPAQDAYDALLDRYPSTRHLDTISKRQFEIARRWMGFPEGVVGSDVKPVSYAEVAAGTPTPPPAERVSQGAGRRSSDPTIAISVLPNFHDSTRPLFDTTGRALNGLKNVWLNDPTGELADDALFLSAGHYLRKGDYMEAGRLYDILRKEYPDSVHQKDAYLLSAYAREVVWQGPEYDDRGLEESREIKEAFVRLFPDAAEREQVRESLANMAEAEAESDWATLQLYERKGKPKSIAIYARKILIEHPDSRAAGRARRVWDALPDDAKVLAGPVPPAGGTRAEAPLAPQGVERSVRPRSTRPATAPVTAPVTSPATAPTEPPARSSFDPSPLPGSTQDPGDPFSGMDPFSDGAPF